MENKIQAELKFLFSPDADPIETFAPAGPFGILVMAMIGPAGEQGHESFDFMLCTPERFASRMDDEIEMGRHYLFVREFNHARLTSFVRDYCATCTDTSWQAVANKLGRLGKWEFEDYVHRVEPPALW